MNVSLSSSSSFFKWSERYRVAHQKHQSYLELTLICSTNSFIKVSKVKCSSRNILKQETSWKIFHAPPCTYPVLIKFALNSRADCESPRPREIPWGKMTWMERRCTAGPPSIWTAQPRGQIWKAITGKLSQIGNTDRQLCIIESSRIRKKQQPNVLGESCWCNKTRRIWKKGRRVGKT